MERIWGLRYFGNSIGEYLTSLAVLIGGWTVVFIVHRFAVGRVRRWADKTKSTLDDFVVTVGEKTLVPLLYFGVFYVALQNLLLNASLKRAFNVIGIVLFTVLAIRFISQVVRYTVFNYWVQKHPNRELLETQFKGFMPAISLTIWIVGVIFLMDNLGFKISAVIAGLGIGGVALALASQAVLADLFSYLAIMFDKPFVIGDFIIVGSFMGTVEHIGIKTTRIRSLSGEQLVFCNKDLTGQTVSNYKRMQTRRIVFRFGVEIQTDNEKLRAIPESIKTIISGIPKTTFDRAHFFSYADFSLVYEVVYFMLTDDYNKYMDVQQEINLRMKEEFEKRGIRFAVPTQVVRLVSSERNATPSLQETTR